MTHLWKTVFPFLFGPLKTKNGDTVVAVNNKRSDYSKSRFQVTLSLTSFVKGMDGWGFFVIVVVVHFKCAFLTNLTTYF